MRTKWEHRVKADAMEAEKHEEPAFDLEAAADQAIAACEGNMRATVRALVVANNFLTAQNEALSNELDCAWRWISPGYMRSTGRRRMKSSEPD